MDGSASSPAAALVDALKGVAVSAVAANVLGELWYIAGRDLRATRLFTRDEQLKDARATLKRSDSDGKGLVSYAQLKQSLAALGMPSSDQRGKGLRRRFVEHKKEKEKPTIPIDQIIPPLTPYVLSPFINLLGSLPDGVRRMSWDSTGERMLVHGTRVSVVQCRAADRLSATYVAAAKPLAPQLPSTAVLAAEWHALSVGHVVMLTSDAVRIYCIDRDSDDAEAVIRAPAAARTTSLARFAFGPPRGLWLRLSLFLLSSRGDLWALCPVLPVGAPFPAKLLGELREAAEAETEQLATAMHELEEDEVEEAERRALWASEVRGRSLAQLAPSYGSSASSSLLTPSASVDEDTVDGAGSGLCLTQLSPNQRSELLLWQSIPVDGVESRSQSATAAPALMVLNTDPVIIVRYYGTTGQAELLLSLAEPQARWISAATHSAVGETSPLVLIENLTLPAHSQLVADPLATDRFYVVSPDVRRVLLTWLPALQRALTSATVDPASALADLPSATVEVLLQLPVANSTQPHADFACELLTGRLRRHLLVVCGTKAYTVEADAAIVPPPLLVAEGAPRNAPAQYTQPQRPRPPVAPQVGGEFEISLNGATKLQKIIASLRKEHLMFLAYLSEDSSHRADSIRATATGQARELEDLRADLEKQRKNAEILAAKMAACKARHANVATRLAAVSELLTLHSTQLSEEERAWHDEVRQKQARAMQLRNTVADLRERLAKLGPLATVDASSTAHLDHIAPLVARQQELIAANIARLNEVKAAVAQLAPQP